ncbi:MAG: hypothetical protein KDB26_08895 [Microthrixaceae bacterium]|nr:hypothetical protein [Microthrixaceae bacterium]
MTQEQDQGKSAPNSGTSGNAASSMQVAADTYNKPCTPQFAYIDDGEEPHLLAVSELYAEVMQCGVPLLEIFEAQARGYQFGNPLGVLAKGIATAMCDAPTASVATGVGSRPAPLNSQTLYVAPSGVGKGLSMDAPMVCANPMGGYRRDAAPASGEAFINMFYEQVPAADGKGVETVRHRDPVWVAWGEIDGLTAKASNASSTLDNVMRSVWSGESVGDASITRQKSGIGCFLEEGSYRSVISIGAQRDHLTHILADETGGTLQRCLFIPIADEDAPEKCADMDAYCRKLYRLIGRTAGVDLDRAPIIAVWGPGHGITVDPAIREEIKEHRAKVIKGTIEVDPLDTHANNLRARLAAVFAGWIAGQGNPAVVDRNTWWWAGCLMAISRSLREELREEAQKTKTKVARDAGKSDAERWDARQEALRAKEIARQLKYNETYVKAAVRVAKRSGRGASMGEISAEVGRGGARDNLKDCGEEVLKYLVDTGDFVFEAGKPNRYTPNIKRMNEAA